MVAASAVAWLIVAIQEPAGRSDLERDLHPLSEAEQRLVLAYVEAYQEGNCATIIAMTGWMGERLEYVRTTTGDAAAVEKAQDELCADLQERLVEGNQLTPAGIEDKYLLPPGARVTLLGRDSGREHMESPIAYRAWIKVTYPVDRYAPRDEAGRPIRALAAGVNIAPGGLVMKADVAGNLEVDRRSFEYGSQQDGG